MQNVKIRLLDLAKRFCHWQCCQCLLRAVERHEDNRIIHELSSAFLCPLPREAQTHATGRATESASTSCANLAEGSRDIPACPLRTASQQSQARRPATVRRGLRRECRLRRSPCCPIGRSPTLGGNNAPPSQCSQGALPRARELPDSTSCHAHSAARNNQNWPCGPPEVCGPREDISASPRPAA